MEQAEQGSLVEGTQIAIEAEGNAGQHIADRDAEHQRGHEAADEQRPVPARAPRRVGLLGAIFEAHGPQDERGENEEHREVEAGEADRIDERPCREDRAAAEDEPDLVSLPCRADRVDDHAAFSIGLRDEGEEGGGAEIEPVRQGEADQQDAHQQPPDQPERFIVDGRCHDLSPYSAGMGA